MCLFLNEIKRPVWDQLEREGALGSASDICAILTTMLEDYRKDFRHLYRVRIVSSVSVQPIIASLDSQLTSFSFEQDFEKARILLLLVSRFGFALCLPLPRLSCFHFFSAKIGMLPRLSTVSRPTALNFSEH